MSARLCSPGQFRGPALGPGSCNPGLNLLCICLSCLICEMGEIKASWGDSKGEMSSYVLRNWNSSWHLVSTQVSIPQRTGVTVTDALGHLSGTGGTHVGPMAMPDWCALWEGLFP